MTSTLPSPHDIRSSGPGPLRAVLLVDGVGTAAVGLAALALAGPLADHVMRTGALQAVGAFFVVAGTDMVLVRRLTGRRLATAGRVFGILDLVWAALCVAALLWLLDTTALGTTLVLAVVATCLGMGTAKLSLARRLGQRPATRPAGAASGR